MANERLQIVLDAVWRGKNAVQKAEQDIRGVDKASQGADNRLKQLAIGVGAAAAAFGTVAVAAREVYRTLQEGAALDRTRGKFDALSDSIGTTADTLLNDLRGATRGMVSDADLMSSAVELINVGIASSREEAVRFANAVSTLGVDMSQLTLTIVNQSKMRLDSLGLSVGAVETRFDELRTTMSDEQAWKIAVLESLEEKMELFGDASDTTAGKLQILEAQWANTNNAFKESFAAALAGELDMVATNAENAVSPMQELAEAAGRLSGIALGGGLGEGITSLSANLQIWEALQAGEIGFGRAMSLSNMANNGQAAVAIAYLDAMNQQEQNLFDAQQELAEARVARARSMTTPESRMNQQGQLLRDAQEQMALARVGRSRNPMPDFDALAMVTDELSVSQRALRGELSANYVNLDALAMVTDDAQTSAFGYKRFVDDLTTSIEDNDEATRRAAEAQKAYMSGMFGQAIAGQGPQFMTDPAEFVQVGGRTAEQNALLGEFRDAYERAASTVRDYQSGLRGFGMDQEDINERIDDAQQLMNYYGGKIQELEGITGEWVATNEVAALNQEVLNTELYKSIEAAGGSAEQLANAGVALGQFTDEEAKAAIRTAAIAEKIRELGQAVADGMAPEQAQRDLMAWIDGYDRTTAAAETAALKTEENSEKTKDYIETINQVQEEKVTRLVLEEEDARTALERFRDMLDELPDTVNIDFTGAVSVSGAGGTSRTGGIVMPVDARAMGGPVYGGVPYLVGERGPELFVPNTNGSIAPNGAFGGVTINAYNRESAAVAMAWVSNARRSRLDSRMGVAA